MNTLYKIITTTFLLFTLSACCGDDPAIEKINNFINKQQINKTDSSWKTSLTNPPLLTFTSGKDYFWDLETNQGKLSIKLYTDSAPVHVSSTIYLTKLGFYDGLTFHRVIPGFMAQGGDPLGTGAGNPGYKYQGEFSGNKSHNKAGILIIANAGPNTDGSQFFITFKPTPYLDGKHTVFGEVVAGYEDSLAKIESLGSMRGKTKEPVQIIKATIRVMNHKQ